jgi:hypothetical protein
MVYWAEKHINICIYNINSFVMESSYDLDYCLISFSVHLLNDVTVSYTTNMFLCYLVCQGELNCFGIVIIWSSTFLSYVYYVLNGSTSACDVTILKYIMWTVIQTNCLIATSI